MSLTTEYQNCACCGEALDVIVQRVIRLHILVTCNNQQCPMYGFTDCPVQHEANARHKAGCTRSPASAALA